MEHDVASGQMYAYTEIPTTSPPGYRRERLIIPLGLWSFPVDEKPIFPFFVDWALGGGASMARPRVILSTVIVDWHAGVLGFVDWGPITSTSRMKVPGMTLDSARGSLINFAVDHHDVDGLCREFPNRLQALVDNEGDRINK